jgi:DNA-binding response OmpR family regulator
VSADYRAASATGRTPPLVAVVDDEEDINTFLALALADNGFAVVTCADSGKVLALLEERRPDVVCLDLLMPRQTGLSLYSELVHHPLLAGTPIVIMSGLADTAEIETILGHGGELPQPASIVEKPIDIEQLLRILNGLLHRPLGVAP